MMHTIKTFEFDFSVKEGASEHCKLQCSWSQILRAFSKESSFLPRRTLTLLWNARVHSNAEESSWYSYDDQYACACFLHSLQGKFMTKEPIRDFHSFRPPDRSACKALKCKKVHACGPQTWGSILRFFWKYFCSSGYKWTLRRTLQPVPRRKTRGRRRFFVGFRRFLSFGLLSWSSRLFSASMQHGCLTQRQSRKMTRTRLFRRSSRKHWHFTSKTFRSFSPSWRLWMTFVRIVPHTIFSKASRVLPSYWSMRNGVSTARTWWTNSRLLQRAPKYRL